MASAALVLGVALSGEAHAQSSFNGTQATPFTLTTGTQTSPFSFGAAAYIGPTAGATSAVAGDSGTNWNVTNDGTLNGGHFGIYLRTPGGNNVTNAGTIIGTTGDGIYVKTGGSVTNQGSATITGLDGVRVLTNAGAVSNAGTITGTGNYGVNFFNGGSVTNQAGATISGGTGGVRIVGAAGAVTNAGTITGTNNSGVVLAAGGSITNQTGATIRGLLNGLYVGGAAGTVTNAGSITGDRAVYLKAGGNVTNSGTINGLTGGVGVYIIGGGSVTNQSGGTISGGVRIFGGGVVTNAGTISGINHDGVVLFAGASLTNQAGGTISGRNGVSSATAAATLTNAGAITGTTRQGIEFLAGGFVTNQAGATISGASGGVYIRGTGGDMITNAGTITGAGGTAVQFGGAGAKTLVLQTGSVLNGEAVGSTTAGATNALILQGSGAANNNFLNFNTLDVLAGGVWALNGVSTIGTTAIDSGTLMVGDAAHPGAQLTSAVTVNASGTLAGQGTVIGDIAVLSGGTFAPGNGVPGNSMTVTGNLAFQSGAFYLVQLNPATASLANVSGTATLTGGSVQAVLASGSYAKHSYDILHATGGLGGTTFVGSNLPGFSQSLTYTTTDVFLNLTAAALGAGGGLTINQQNVVTAINNFFNSGGALPPGFVPLFGLSGGNLGNALTQLSGEAATGTQQVAFQMMTGFLNIMIDPTIDGRGGFGGGGGATPFAPERTALPEDIALAYAGVMKAPATKAPAFEQRWSAWGSAFGGVNHTSGDPAVVGSHDLSANVAGVAAGFDYHLTRDTLIGFALAGGGTNWSLGQNLGGGRSDAFQAGVYAKTRNGPAYLAASLAYAEHWMSTDRFAFAADHLTARFNAQSYGGRIEGGYRFATDFVGVTPYAALQVQAFHTPGYSETDLTGGGFGLGFAARDATDTRSELGSRFDREQAVSPDAVLVLRGRAAWAHDWVSNPTLTAAFQALPGASFIVSGATPAKDSALASAGAELRWRSGWSLSAKFDGEIASRAQTYAGTGTVRYSW